MSSKSLVCSRRVHKYTVCELWNCSSGTILDFIVEVVDSPISSLSVTWKKSLWIYIRAFLLRIMHLMNQGLNICLCNSIIGALKHLTYFTQDKGWVRFYSNCPIGNSRWKLFTSNPLDSESGDEENSHGSWGLGGSRNCLSTYQCNCMPVLTVHQLISHLEAIVHSGSGGRILPFGYFSAGISSSVKTETVELALILNKGP